MLIFRLTMISTTHTLISVVKLLLVHLYLLFTLYGTFFLRIKKNHFPQAVLADINRNSIFLIVFQILS